MLLAPVALAVGLLAGLAAGGRPTESTRPRLHWWWLLPVAIVLALVPAVVDDLGGDAVLIALATAAGAGLALANLHLTGAAVVAVGLGLNLVPLAIDGAVTVAPDSAEHVGAADDDLGPARRLETDDDRVAFLGDNIPVPGLGMLVSFGDLVVLVALVDVGFRLLRPRDDLVEPTATPTGTDEEDEDSVDDDDWLAIVRGDMEAPHGQTPPPGPVTPPTGPIRIADQPASVPWTSATTGTTPAAREPEVDLSLIRWGSDDAGTAAEPSGGQEAPPAPTDEPRIEGGSVEAPDPDATTTAPPDTLAEADTGELDLRELPGLLDDTNDGAADDAADAAADDGPAADAATDDASAADGDDDPTATGDATDTETRGATDPAGDDPAATPDDTDGPAPGSTEPEPGVGSDSEFSRLLARFDADRRRLPDPEA